MFKILFNIRYLNAFKIFIVHQEADILDVNMFDSIKLSWNNMRSFFYFSDKLINSYKVNEVCSNSWSNCQILSSKLSFMDDVFEKRTPILWSRHTIKRGHSLKVTLKCQKVRCNKRLWRSLFLRNNIVIFSINLTCFV